MDTFQCFFLKVFLENCLFPFFWEKWKQTIGNNQAFGALLIHLSKASDFLPHKALTVELIAHGFHLKAVKMMNNYLYQTNQRTKINESSSSWEQIIFGVPQDLMLRAIISGKWTILGQIKCKSPQIFFEFLSQNSSLKSFKPHLVTFYVLNNNFYYNQVIFGNI